MPKPDKNRGGAAERISDARFASFQTDPRFRLPSKKNTKTKLDKRFAGMLNDKEFTDTARVDRYGRKLKSDTKKKALQRLYEAEEDEEEQDEDENEDDEDEDEEQVEIEIEDDDIIEKELRAADKKALKYDPARGGGFSSSDDSDSDEDSEDEEAEELDAEGDMQRLQDEHAEVEEGEVTKRIAVVNLDWDHVNSTDLFALFSSFLGEDPGKVIKVSVYPSEFGKERMQQEEVEGPPKALFKNGPKEDSSSSEDEDDDEKIRDELIQEGDDQDFDSDALRSYQLSRLRYYYAVMECSSESAAQKIYEATDGTEYQSSSNFIDLRFVPDDVTFDDEPRDVCTKVPETYKPVEFVTTAMQSSKVKLTWDMHPEEATRKESIKRAFTGSRADINENDLRAYLASDSEDSDAAIGDDDEEDGEGEGAPKLSKKELARKKMREALGLTEETTARASKDGPVGGMEITFTPALSENNKDKDDGEEETTIEKYKRKERERKDRRREKSRAKRVGEDDDDAEEDEGGMTATFGAGEEDLGFDDPFFTTEDPSAGASKSAVRKQERLKKREARLEAEEASKKERAKLAKVMAEDNNDGETAEHLDHFDMAEIMRAEKIRGKKGKAAKSKKNKDKLERASGLLQDDFKMDVDDKRFQAVFDSHEYAIDPSNPKFKATGGMKQLLEEGRKKRRGDDNDAAPRKKTKGRK